jgi:hypothetical protein
LHRRPHKGYPYLLLPLWLLLSISVCAADLAGRVIAVPDANRIILLTPDERRLPVALLGLGVPGDGDRTWREIGRRHLRMLLAGRHVQVESATPSSSGVILGAVRHGGADVGLRLLGSGLAILTDDTDIPAALRQQYLAAQREARRRGMGYWQSVR